MYIKEIVLLKVVILSVFFSSLSFAGSSSGAPDQLTSNIASKIFFRAGTHVGAPSCATNSAGQWALDATTPSGKAMYAMLLTAQALERSVVVTGNNTCNVQPDRESVQFMQMN